MARIRYCGAFSEKKNIAADFRMGGGASLPKGVHFLHNINFRPKRGCDAAWDKRWCEI